MFENDFGLKKSLSWGNNLVILYRHDSYTVRILMHIIMHPMFLNYIWKNIVLISAFIGDDKTLDLL